MPLGVIFFFASQGCAYASLGGSSVRASGIQLAEYSRACRSRGVQGSHETGAASPDDDDVKLVGSHAMIPGPPSQGHDKNKGKRKILPDYYNLTYSIDIDFYRKKRLAGIDFFNKSIAGERTIKRPLSQPGLHKLQRAARRTKAKISNPAGRDVEMYSR
jgi:hypothetical protein